MLYEGGVTSSQRGDQGTHLGGVVPVEAGSFEDKPEALPLLRQEDTVLLPLLPEPAVAVSAAQLPT